MKLRKSWLYPQQKGNTSTKKGVLCMNIKLIVKIQFYVRVDLGVMTMKEYSTLSRTKISPSDVV